ncbi:type II secretion system F family protein [Fusobacterium sp. MFO224]|uniref:type II secretion system F family protein n=1 Tax=Fusobacterium sp. MFO224 TaxID=3378070 RepID=UPI0038552F50
MNKYMSFIFNKEGKKKVVFNDEVSKKDLKKIFKENKQFLIKTFVIKKHNLKDSELLNFFIKLRIFVESGYQFYDAINFFSSYKRFKNYTKRMKNSLKNGEKISFIFKDSGLNLKKIDFIILKTGEESGNLVKSFLIIEDRLKNRIKLKRKLKKILIYPEILLIFVLLIIIFLGKFILPNFVDMLNEMEITISKTTKWIIWFANNFLYIAALIITMIFILKKLKKINYIFFNCIYKVKIIRNYITNLYKENFLEALLILLKSDIDLVYAIRILEKEELNKNFKIKLNNILFNFEAGKNIEYSFKESKIFNNGELDFIRLGEKSGELVKTLEIIYSNNKKDMENKIEIIIKLLEPFTIIIMGIVILFIFKGIYFPLLKIIDNI